MLEEAHVEDLAYYIAANNLTAREQEDEKRRAQRKQERGKIARIKARGK